jgi:hypothetical protein
VKAERYVRNKVLRAVTMKIFRVHETLKLETAHYPETAMNMHQNTWRYIPEDSNL